MRFGGRGNRHGHDGRIIQDAIDVMRRFDCRISGADFVEPVGTGVTYPSERAEQVEISHEIAPPRAGAETCNAHHFLQGPAGPASRGVCAAVRDEGRSVADTVTGS